MGPNRPRKGPNSCKPGPPQPVHRLNPDTIAYIPTPAPTAVASPPAHPPHQPVHLHRQSPAPRRPPPPPSQPRKAPIFQGRFRPNFTLPQKESGKRSSAKSDEKSDRSIRESDQKVTQRVLWPTSFCGTLKFPLKIWGLSPRL